MENQLCWKVMIELRKLRLREWIQKVFRSQNLLLTIQNNQSLQKKKQKRKLTKKSKRISKIWNKKNQ